MFRCLMFLLLLALLYPRQVLAAPHQVTIFPTSAQIEEKTTVTATVGSEGPQCTLILPGQADPATLRLGQLPTGSSLVDIRWEKRQEENQVALEKLNAELKDLTNQHNKIMAELKGVRGRLNFWQAQAKPLELSVAALRELATEIDETIHRGTGQALTLEQALDEVEEKLELVKEQIARTGGQAPSVWNVRILFAGEAPKELSYTYTLTDCGWTPLYRLDAQPAQEQIEFSWQAQAWQSSGQDWNDVQLFLATMQPTLEAEPEELWPWEIRPMELARPRAMPGGVFDGAPNMAAPMMAKVEEAPIPQEIRHATYALWDMGKRSLPAGETRSFEIEREAWPTKFTHLIRPSQNPKAFLQAETSFAQAKELPHGTGMFLVEGAMLDQRKFSFAGREGTFFFGTNPLLGCEVTLLDKKTGKKGLISKKQSFVWHWELTINNAANYATNVRVEEPKPLARDERIVLQYSATPKPGDDPDPKLLAWETTIAPGADSRIEIQVSVEAPGDLMIDPGWRW